MNSSKYVHSSDPNAESASSKTSTTEFKETRKSITLQQPQKKNTSDTDYVTVNRHLVFVPVIPANIGEHAKAKLAAQSMSKDFRQSMRLRSRRSVIGSHLLLALLYIGFLFNELLSSNGSAGIATNFKTVAPVARAVQIVLALNISFLATRESWIQSQTSSNALYLFLILFKQLITGSLQLMQVIPDYGQLLTDQACMWTFLPLHPLLAGIISSSVWLAYGLSKWSGLASNMPALNPFILIGVGLIQSYGHFRRYHGMMNGFLEAKRVDIQRILMSTESSKCDDLLRSMLPPSIIIKLELGESITPERFDSVTVMFTEICHFSGISRRASAHELVNVLNDVFTTFDELIDKWSVYKVETVCQVYMAVAGCPKRFADHASEAANLALEMIQCIQYMAGGSATLPSEELMSSKLTERRARVMSFMGDERLQIHVGLNSGPVRAGVVGINNPRFKLFGDTVNTASRMESTCEPGRVQVSPTTFELLQKSQKYAFDLQKRGEIQVKGKGTMTTHYVCSVDQIKTTTVVVAAPAPASTAASKEVLATSSPALRRKQSASLMDAQAKQMRAFHQMSKGAADIEGQQIDEPKDNDRVGSVLDSSNCTLLYLRARRIALLTIESDIDLETLKALEDDACLYRLAMFPSRVKWLQLKILILLMGLSFVMSLTDYTVFLSGAMNQERQVMTLLRNAVVIPVLVVLLMSCRSEAWFMKHGEKFALFTGFVAAAVCLVTIFIVYNGDPGIAAAMCILVLDVELLRLPLRVMMTVVLLLIYSVMIFMSRDSAILATIAMITLVCALFALAIHGQEHFNHLADCERRDLEMQTKQLQTVRRFVPTSAT